MTAVVMFAAVILAGVLIYFLTGFVVGWGHTLYKARRNRETVLERRITAILDKYPNDPEAAALRDVLLRVKAERIGKRKIREIREAEKGIDEYIKRSRS